MICRYKVKGIIVDVMPTGENTLGFTNHWYKKGYATAIDHSLDEDHTIRIFHPVYFLASKMVAFNDRGGGDGRWSSDFEDIIYLLNNRSVIWQELRTGEEEVKGYLKTQFRQLLQNPYIDEWIASHLEYSEQKRIRKIIGEMNSFAEE